MTESENLPLKTENVVQFLFFYRPNESSLTLTCCKLVPLYPCYLSDLSLRVDLSQMRICTNYTGWKESIVRGYFVVETHVKNLSQNLS